MAPPLFDDKPQQLLAFTRDKRLLSSQDFEQVFSACKFRASDKYCLILAKPNSLQHPRLGLIVAKKHVKLAVQRNRIKRLIRESFRQRQHQLASVDAIVLTRKGLDVLENSNILKQLNRLWQSINTQAINSET